MTTEAQNALSLTALKSELEQMRADYVAFSRAYDLIRQRILESNELPEPRVPLLHQWSGTSAVCGALELSINAIRRTVDEYLELIRKVEDGEIENSDVPRAPVLTVYSGDKK